MKIRCTQMKYEPIFYLCASAFYLWPIFFSFTSVAAAAPTTQRQGLSAESTVVEILDALDARGKDLKDFSAQVSLATTDDSTGDSSSTSGKVIYQSKGNGDARIIVSFDKWITATNLMQKINHRYVLDNGVLDDRDYTENRETINHVLKPGEKLDLFKLGEGPFPLPLGQDKADVLTQFAAVKIAPESGDPAQTVHLQLTPKAGSQFAGNYKTIDIWVDMTTGMPRRIQTDDVNQTTTRTTDLTNVKVNSGVTDKDFILPPMPPGSDVVEGPSAQ
jgi:outer membrane lipoprotein-sorting protein